MGNLQRRQPVDDGARHDASRKSGSAAGVSPGRDAGSDRDRSDGHGHLRPLRPSSTNPRLSTARSMSPTHVRLSRHSRASVAGRSDHAELEALLRGMGYQPVLVNGAEQMAALRDPVSLCLIDLRENGEALRSARAMRAQHPQSVRDRRRRSGPAVGGRRRDSRRRVRRAAAAAVAARSRGAARQRARAGGAGQRAGAGAGDRAAWPTASSARRRRCVW